MNIVLEKKEEVLGLGELEQKAPGLYEVILHNDDFTPMDFVVRILEQFFHLDIIKAKRVMLEAHTKGRAVCGIFCREVAETKIELALEYARMYEHPLRWSMEGA